MEKTQLTYLKQIAAGIAAQFGDKCEVVIHDVSSSHLEHTIVHIENGHVSGRKVGDGASKIVMEQMMHQNEKPQDHLCYLTRTPDGKMLKSSSMYIRNRNGTVFAILSINYDISNAALLRQQLGTMISRPDKQQTASERALRVSDMLASLIEQSVSLIGKPVEDMDKDDKIRAVRFLNDSGAFLVTKSADRVEEYFGISKYTLYSYINANKQQEEKKK